MCYIICPRHGALSNRRDRSTDPMVAHSMVYLIPTRLGTLTLTIVYREGPRLRVTTVRKCAALIGNRLPNQAPAALHPSRQVGGGPVAFPPWGWARTNPG